MLEYPRDYCFRIRDPRHQASTQLISDDETRSELPVLVKMAEYHVTSCMMLTCDCLGHCDCESSVATLASPPWFRSSIPHTWNLFDALSALHILCNPEPSPAFLRTQRDDRISHRTALCCRPPRIGPLLVIAHAHALQLKSLSCRLVAGLGHLSVLALAGRGSCMGSA